MSMWKQLFSEAPPGAVEQLLSPKRKLLYALFAFGPGTLLALFLSSVKRDMEREDEARRLAHVAEEMQGEQAREQKDQLLIGMIQDLRDRLQALEQEARDKQQQQQQQRPATATPEAAAAAIEQQAPTATGDWEKQKVAFLSASALDSSAAAQTDNKAQSGISARIQQRERERVQEDVRAFKAAKAADDAARKSSS